MMPTKVGGNPRKNPFMPAAEDGGWTKWKSMHPVLLCFGAIHDLPSALNISPAILKGLDPPLTPTREDCIKKIADGDVQ